MRRQASQDALSPPVSAGNTLSENCSLAQPQRPVSFSDIPSPAATKHVLRYLAHVQSEVKRNLLLETIKKFDRQVAIRPQEKSIGFHNSIGDTGTVERDGRPLLRRQTVSTNRTAPTLRGKFGKTLLDGFLLRGRPIERLIQVLFVEWSKPKNRLRRMIARPARSR